MVSNTNIQPQKHNDETVQLTLLTLDNKKHDQISTSFNSNIEIEICGKSRQDF